MDDKPIINGPFKIERLSDEVPSRVKFSVDLAGYLLSLKQLISASPDEKYKATVDFHRHQHALASKLSGIEGDLFWSNVMDKMFHCEDSTSSSPLQQWLSASDSSDALDVPFAFTVMQTYFIEILKNAMDAKITQSLTDPRIDSSVEIEIGCEKNPDHTLSIHLKDNGPGFSHDYLLQFEQLKRERAYASGRSTMEKLSTNYFFGGAGKGLRGLAALCLEGLGLDNRGGMKLFDVPLGATDLNIATGPRGGAFITLTTPIAPIMPHSFIPYMDSSNADYDNDILTPLSIETEEGTTPRTLSIAIDDEETETLESTKKPTLSLSIDDNASDESLDEEQAPTRPFRR